MNSGTICLFGNFFEGMHTNPNQSSFSLPLPSLWLQLGFVRFAFVREPRVLRLRPAYDSQQRSKPYEQRTGVPLRDDSLSSTPFERTTPPPPAVEGGPKRYVGNLPWTCDSQQLAEIFQDCGAVELVEVLLITVWFFFFCNGKCQICSSEWHAIFWQNVSGEGVADVLHSFFRSFMIERRPEAVGLDLWPWDHKRGSIRRQADVGWIRKFSSLLTPSRSLGSISWLPAQLLWRRHGAQGCKLRETMQGIITVALGFSLWHLSSSPWHIWKGS